MVSKENKAQIKALSKHFKPDSRIVIVTGAGISAESGVPTFRGKGGLWEKYDPAEVATAEALSERPEKVWEMHDALRQTLNACKPNPAHHAIAELQRLFEHVTVITQNVDNYHQDAGSKQVIEMHGNAWRVKCTAEGTTWMDKTVPYKELPPKCSCGAMIRPDVVFFNEPLDPVVLETAFDEAENAEIMFVVGTSYLVYPAAYLPVLAKETGALLVEINIEVTPLFSSADFSLIGKAGTILPELVKQLKVTLKKN